jgi:conjugal transfer pilus assembly protein TraD
LFAPQLLGQLPDLHYIAKLSGGRIVKGRLPILQSKADEKPKSGKKS